MSRSLRVGFLCQPTFVVTVSWIPAYAGMTVDEVKATLGTHFFLVTFISDASDTMLKKTLSAANWNERARAS